jgi:hypothetical protein
MFEHIFEMQIQTNNKNKSKENIYFYIIKHIFLHFDPSYLVSASLSKVFVQIEQFKLL